MRKQRRVESRKPRIPSPEQQSAMPDSGELIEVSAGLLFRDGRLLITLRPANAHLGGLWEFPGGKRETGETFEQCLRRELREELGVVVRVGERFQSVTHAYPEKTVQLEFYICELITGEPQPLGCAALRWVDRAELKQDNFPAADARVLESLLSNDEFWETPRRDRLASRSRSGSARRGVSASRKTPPPRGGRCFPRP